MRCLLIILAACLPLVAHAVEFDEHTRSLSLGTALEVFEDTSGTATFDDVHAAATAGAFRPVAADTFNAGYSRSAFWLKADLLYRPNDPAWQMDWVLELAYPPIDHVDLYLRDATGQMRLAWRTGDRLPFSSRQISQASYVFDLNLMPGQTTTFYLRVASDGPVQAPLTLWSAHAFMEDQPARIYVLGLIYGVLLGMLVYNLFIYFSVRDPSYLYYIFYVATFGLYQLSISGAAGEYLWPDNPWWANAATPFLMATAVLFTSLFSRSFLQPKALGRWLDYLHLVLMAGAVAVMLSALFANYGAALRLVTVLISACTATMLATGIIAMLKGVRIARYYLVAWLMFLAGAAINAMMLFGYLSNTFFVLYVGQMGAVLEMALLSLALADRLNQIREQQAHTLLQAGKDLERLNHELATGNRLKDQFLATLTHELRTPMNGVIGSLELMQTLDMEAELRTYHQTAAGSARDMMSMIDGILTLSELQAGVLSMRCDDFSLSCLFERLRERFRHLAQAKDVQLVFELDKALPDRVYGDAGKLYQCIECLLDNAVKFTARGTIRLQASGQLQPADQLWLQVVVADTGIGFDHLDDATLYKQFFQVDGSMTRQYGGLGIGLAICRKLIELQGGSLGHVSEPGKGSRFTLSVGLRLGSPGVAGAAAQAPAPWPELR